MQGVINMKMITIKMPKWISNIILKFMKKKLAFFIAVLYNKSCVTENRIMYALLAQLVEQ